MREGACAPSHSIPHLTIIYTQEMVSGICSMDDLYKNTGILTLVKEKTITDVKQIWMNKDECLGLEDIVENNLKRQKKYRYWSEYALHNAVAMDWLCYAPVGVSYVPKGELWIWTQSDANVAMSEYRQWIKENGTDG